MAINALGQYAATHKVWDHVGNLIPTVENSEGIAPAHKFLPAAWLPVKFYEKHFENWITVMPGKLLALDPLGRVMPAQYGLTGASVVYTANDVAAGVIDVSTGAAVTTAKTVVLANLDGTRGTAWTAANAGTGVADSNSSFMGRWGLSFNDATAKYPIGVARLPFLQWAGDGGLLDDGFNPAAYRQNNYNMQSQVTVLCDYVLRLPLIPGQVATETVDNNWTNTPITFDGAGMWRNRTQIMATSRYSATIGLYPCQSTYNVAAWALLNRPVAKNTSRTLITCTISGLLLNEVSSMANISAAGDYWIDYEMGVLFVYSAGGSSLPAVGADTITYYHYATAPAVVSAFASVLSSATELQPGDFLECGVESNFVRANPAHTFAQIIGQVIAIDNQFPKDYLEYVRSAYSPALQTSAIGTMANQVAGSATAGLGQLDQMTGSATGGIPTLITYAGGADQIVLVNLISR